MIKPLRVMLIDESPGCSAILEQALSDSGHQVVARCNARPGARAFGSIAGRPAGWRAERGRGAAVLLAASFDVDGLVDPALFRAELFLPPRKPAPPTDPRRAKTWKDVAVTEELTTLRQVIRPPVYLASAGVHHPRSRMNVAACQQKTKLRYGIDLQVANRIPHALGMADLTGEVEDHVAGADDFRKSVGFGNVPLAVDLLI